MDRKHRKYISWKTKCAACLALFEYLRRPGLNYDQVKKLSEAKFLERWEFDHNILYETRHPDRDKFWNLTPMHTDEHLEKTKRDAAIIAKGRRIRKKKGLTLSEAWIAGMEYGEAAARASQQVPSPFKRKIFSRGFRKDLRRKMDGTVVPK